jgi:hypothetical protein
MKNGWILLVVGVWFSACKEKASTQSQVDSLTKKIDTAASKVIDSAKVDLKKAGKAIDEKVKDLKIKVRDKLDADTTLPKHSKEK